MTRGMILGSGVAGWLALAVVWAVPAVGQETGAPTKATRGAVVYFHNIRDGKRIPQKFTVRLGLKEMGIAPAGVKVPDTGHHHVLIDVDPPPAGQPIPADFNHIHLGNGQTEVELSLTPGQHTLQLVLGDYNHAPHQPPIVSRKVSVTVY